MTTLHELTDGDMGPVITERTPLSIGLLLVVAGFIVTALVAFANLSTRVSVLEKSATQTDQRLQRIEDKVDRLLERAR